MDWLLQDISDIWLNLELWVIYGGIISVSVTIFLMGIFKTLVGNRIQNKLVRKTVLSFLSIILVAPTTAIYLMTNTANGLNYFWYIYAFNSICTIVIYWFYENTQLRELLAVIGRNTLGKVLQAIFSKNSTIQQTSESIRSSVKESVKSYVDDDLKNL